MQFSGGAIDEAVRMLEGIVGLLQPSGEPSCRAASDQDIASMLSHVIEHLGGAPKDNGRYA